MKRIFVFGSNRSGIHGAGAARYAHKFLGAEWGVGEGLTGDSYALPTKGWEINFIPLSEVQDSINVFIQTAKKNPEKEFQVTRVGCGLGGFSDAGIAPLFLDAPDNCLFDEHWKPYLGNHKKYWGSFP